MSRSSRNVLLRQGMSRRSFLRLLSVSTAASAMSPLMTGCAKNPVTGDSQLMFYDEKDEIAYDKKYFPHQFSSDNGAIQDQGLNDYVSQVGMRLATLSHRPNLPYSFNVSNANYVNAYAFPGGSIVATRAIMLELDNEAQLAALLGHETGHVNARHQSSHFSHGTVLAILVGAGAAFASFKYGEDAGYLGYTLGGFACGALLAKYSRDDERQADALGMEYTTRTGLSPQGMVELQQMLVELSDHDPSLLELMMASHPMSTERRATAQEAAKTKYASFMNLPMGKERYMDNTARLRGMAEAIQAQQKGEKLLNAGKLIEAEEKFQASLKLAPEDYPGLLLMSACQAELGNGPGAIDHAQHAREINPKEPQAVRMLGVANLMNDDFNKAYQHFTRYDNLMPGNPQMIFLRGMCKESAGNKYAAAKLYKQFLNQVTEGEQALHAYSRLRDWDMLPNYWE